MFSQEVINAITTVRSTAKFLDLKNTDILVSNLAFMQQVITASERLLQEAADESTGELREYYLNHLEEERAHEAWLADDLKSVGIDVKTLPMMRKAVEMAGSQYYLIKHVHPSSLLGYMAVLEGFPMPLDLVALLESIHGKPLLRTLRYHAEHDIEHRKELFKMIDKQARPEILMSAVQTAVYVNEFSQELTEAQ